MARRYIRYRGKGGWSSSRRMRAYAGRGYRVSKRYVRRQRKAIRLNKSVGYWAPAAVAVATNFNIPEDVTDLLAVMPISGGIAGQVKNAAQGYRFGKLVNRRVIKGRLSLGAGGSAKTLI